MKRPAVFFDRDNTLIACDGYLGDPAKVVLIEGAADAVVRVRDLGFAAVIFSNQSGVARGMFTEEAVHAVNHRLDDLLHEEDPRAVIDRHDFCPFHPTAKVERYRVDSDLRKPRPGMIFQAALVLDLDLEHSWVIGDAPRDIAAGHAAGLRTILLKIASLPPSPATNEGAGVDPDFVATSLEEAVDLIEDHMTVAAVSVTEEADELAEGGRAGGRAGAVSSAVAGKIGGPTAAWRPAPGWDEEDENEEPIGSAMPGRPTEPAETDVVAEPVLAETGVVAEAGGSPAVVAANEGAESDAEPATDVSDVGDQNASAANASVATNVPAAMDPAPASEVERPVQDEAVEPASGGEEVAGTVTEEGVTESESAQDAPAADGTAGDGASGDGGDAVGVQAADDEEVEEDDDDEPPIRARSPQWLAEESSAPPAAEPVDPAAEVPLSINDAFVAAARSAEVDVNAADVTSTESAAPPEVAPEAEQASDVVEPTFETTAATSPGTDVAEAQSDVATAEPPSDEPVAADPANAADPAVEATEPTAGATAAQEPESVAMETTPADGEIKPAAAAHAAEPAQTSPAVDDRATTTAVAAAADEPTAENLTVEPARTEEPVKFTPRPSSAKPTNPPAAKPDPSKPAAAAGAESGNAATRGGFVVKPNQAPPRMTWGERMRVAKVPSGPGTGASSPTRPAAPAAAAPEPAPAIEAAPVEPEVTIEEATPATPTAPTTPVGAAELGRPAPAAASVADEAEELPPVADAAPLRRGLRREDVGTGASRADAAGDDRAADGDPAEPTTALAVRRSADEATSPVEVDAAADPSPAAGRPASGIRPPTGDFGRVEDLLEQILIELRRREEQGALDFSVTKLLAGITQVLALFVMFLAYLNKDSANSLLPTLVAALTLQTLTISLLIMGRQR